MFKINIKYCIRKAAQLYNTNYVILIQKLAYMPILINLLFKINTFTIRTIY